MFCIENAQNRTVVLKQVGKETNRLFEHVLTERRKAGEVRGAFFVELGEVANMEPLTGEFDCQASHPGTLQHTSRLGEDLFGRVKLPRVGGGTKRVVGSRRPEEIAQSAGELVLRNGVDHGCIRF